MININSVVLVGRLANDIELRKTESNKSVTRFTVAIDEGYGDNKSTNFISCTAWQQSADFMSKYAKKGDYVSVNGHIKTGSYDKNGGKVYTTDIMADRVQIISKDGKEKAGFTPTERIEPDDLPFY